ncbi:unnamed protein product [Trichobilharzia regenti]|nr:unnamed protein product [Trichobilharzia regenti]
MIYGKKWFHHSKPNGIKISARIIFYRYGSHLIKSIVQIVKRILKNYSMIL